MNYHFDQPLDRTKERSKTWDFRVLKPGQIPMHGAETHFTCPFPVLEAVRAVSECEIYGYPYFTDDFSNAAAGWMKRRHGWETDPKWIEFVGGIVPGIAFAIQAMTNIGDNVVINTPAYAPFRDCVKNNDRVLLESPLIIDMEQGTTQFDWADMEAKFSDPMTSAFILCDPHNPTGKCCTREELVKLSELSEKYNVFVIVDEVHADFVFDKNVHIPYPVVNDYAKNHSAVTINPSKTFNVAGFRTGAIIIPNDAARARVNRKIAAVKGISRTITGVAAFEACYDGRSDDYVDHVKGYVGALRELLCTYVKENIPEMKILKPEASFVCWADCRGLGFATQKELLRFFADAGVLLSDGHEYDETLGDGFVRIAYGFPRPQLQEALEKLKAAVAKRRAEVK